MWTTARSGAIPCWVDHWREGLVLSRVPNSAERLPMEMDEMIIVSVDDHVVEPPTMFDQHLTAAQKQHAPRNMRSNDGMDFWWYEGKKLPNIGINAVAG